MSSLRVIRNQKGQALVEFAIVLPLLLLIIMGILQFGMMINSYLTVQNASREGARAGIVGTSYLDIKNLILSDSPNLDPTCLTVDITPGESQKQSGSTLTVSVIYRYKLIVPIISSLFNNEVMLNGSTSMRIE